MMIVCIATDYINAQMVRWYLVTLAWPQSVVVGLNLVESTNMNSREKFVDSLAS